MHRFNLGTRPCDWGTCVLMGRFRSRRYRIMATHNPPIDTKDGLPPVSKSIEIRRLCDYHAVQVKKMDPTLEVIPC